MALNMTTAGTCATEGCSLPIKAKGLCCKHHQQWYRAKNRTKPPRRRSVCSIAGCGKLGHSKDIYCRNHQRRFLLYGDPLLGVKPIQYHCDIDGCNGVHLAKGLCKKHYAQANAKKKVKTIKSMGERLVAINQMIQDPVWDDLLKFYSERKLALTN